MTSGALPLILMLKLSQMGDTLNFYTDNADDFFNRTVELDLSALYQEFLPLLPAGGTILDAGCGSGRDSRYFMDKGFKIHAIDASTELARRASDFIGQAVEATRFEDFQSNVQFDGIWACASLLHTTPEQLPETILHLSSFLHSGGIFYMSFKYGQGETVRRNRLFSDMDESGLRVLESQLSSLALNKAWITEELRPNRENETWMNALWVK